MRASPCSPPSPCRMVCTTPSASSHMYDEGDPLNMRTQCLRTNPIEETIRSCLKKLKSFLLSKFDVDPIHRVLMFSPHFLLEQS